MKETDAIDEYILQHIDEESDYLKALYRDTHVKLLGDGIIFRERVLDKVLNLYKPEIYKLSDYSKIWRDKGFYPYGNEFMIVK